MNTVAEPPRRSGLRRLYDWTLAWSAHPRALWALTAIAFAESSFFPIPPDLLLIPMVLAQPRLGLWLAGWCTLGSVLGGVAGYGIGFYFWDFIGQPIIHLYGAEQTYAELAALFKQYDAWVIFVAAFSPVPYKVFTITAGVMQSDFWTFVLTSIAGRGGRFFLVAGLLMLGGERLRHLVERHLDRLTVLILILAALAYLSIKLIP
ncbi:MAG: DedA family protein [Magnetococcus sp. WYHC-3]